MQIMQVMHVMHILKVTIDSSPTFRQHSHKRINKSEAR